MIIRFSTKNNYNGNRHQLEVDTDKKEYQYGYFLFYEADIKNLTNKQLKKIIDILIAHNFKKG